MKKALFALSLLGWAASGCATTQRTLVGEYRAVARRQETLSLAADGSFLYCDGESIDIVFPGTWEANSNMITLDFVMVGEGPHVVKFALESKGGHTELVRESAVANTLIKAPRFVPETPNQQSLQPTAPSGRG